MGPWGFFQSDDRLSHDYPYGYTLVLDEDPATCKEGAETPTALSGHGQGESRLLAPFYDR